MNAVQHTPSGFSALSVIRSDWFGYSGRACAVVEFDDFDDQSLQRISNGGRSTITYPNPPCQADNVTKTIPDYLRIHRNNDDLRDTDMSTRDCVHQFWTAYSEVTGWRVKRWPCWPPVLRVMFA